MKRSRICTNVQYEHNILMYIHMVVNDFKTIYIKSSRNKSIKIKSQAQSLLLCQTKCGTHGSKHTHTHILSFSEMHLVLVIK